jgi:ATP-dependent Clp protease ATP-binding subunit ClpC
MKPSQSTSDVMALARKYASERGDACVGTEHLLLGILGCSRGPAVRALATCGATESLIRNKLSKLLVNSSMKSDSPLELVPVPRVRWAQERAAAETPEHLLIALIADHETVAAQVLLCLSVDLQQLATEVAREAGW